MDIVVEFYKKLFGEEERMDIDLEENFWGEDEKVTQGENEMLDKEFTKKETKDAVFGSYA
jgi:hypothetical protein